jgi:hypothetical protein
MDDRIPNEEEALADVFTDEYEARLDELERELPSFERETRLEGKARRERGDA